MKKIFRKFISSITSLILFFTYSFPAFAEANLDSNNYPIEVHPDSAKQGVNVSTGANPSVPVVNISSPSESGTSYNKFTDYNTGPNGVVINNSPTHSSSQLSGHVMGNKNLSDGRSASVIIHHVVSQNPSKIDGGTEIVGQKAAYILANPSGISVNGAEFINSSSVTLSTGNPSMSHAGDLEKLTVSEGKVEIKNKDLDLTGLDYFDIVTKVVSLSSKLHANDVNITTGNHQYSPNSRSSSKTSQESNIDSSCAIDSTNLGGIYAGRISIVSEGGALGVNLPNLHAKSLSVTSDGRIVHRDLKGETAKIETLSGGVVVKEGSKIEVRESYKVKSRENLRIEEGVNLTSKAVDLEVGGDISNYGNITTKQLSFGSKKFGNSGKINIQENGNFRQLELFQNLGEIRGGQLSFDSGDFENLGAIIARNLFDSKQFGSFLNKGKISAETISIQANAGLINFGSILSNSTISINSSFVDNNTRGRIVANNDILISASDYIKNGENSYIRSVNSNIFLNGKIIENKGAFSANAEFNTGPSLEKFFNYSKLTANTINIRATDSVLNDGVIKSKKSAVFISNNYESNLGELSAGENLTLSSNNIILRNSKISGKNLEINNTDSITTEGQAKIVGSEILRMSISSNADFSSDTTLSTQKFSIIGTNLSIRNKATIKAEDIEVSSGIESFENAGIINATNSIRLVASNIITNLQSGLINSDGEIFIKADELTNSGQIVSASDLGVIFQKSILNSGEIKSTAGKISLSGKSIENSGLINGFSDVTINSSNYHSIGGELSSKDGKIYLSALDFINLKVAKILSGKEIFIKTRVMRSGTASIVHSFGDLTFDGDVLSNFSSSSILANGKLSLIGSGLYLDNEGKIIVSGMIDASQNSKIRNFGLIKSGSNIILKARQSIHNKGEIISHLGGVTFSADKVENLGSIKSYGNINISDNVRSIRNIGGEIYSSSGHLILKASEKIKNISGNFVSKLSQIIKAQEFIARGGRLISDSGINIDSKHISLSSYGDVNSEIISNGNLEINTGNLNLESSSLQASGNINIESSGEIRNIASSIVSDGQITIRARKLRQESESTIQSSSGDIKINLEESLENISNSSILTDGGNLEIASPIFLNEGGIEAKYRMLVNVERFTNFQNSELMAEEIEITSKDFNNDGQIIGNRFVVASSETPLLLGINGHIFSKGSISLSSAAEIINNGKISAYKLDLNSQTKIINQGVIYSLDGGMNIAAPIIENSGMLGTTGNFVINTNEFTNNNKILAAFLDTNILGTFQNTGAVLISGDWRGKINGSLFNAGNLTVVGKVGLESIGAGITNTNYLEFKGGTIGELLIQGDFTNSKIISLGAGSNLNVQGDFSSGSDSLLLGLEDSKINIKAKSINSAGKLFFKGNSAVIAATSGPITLSELYASGDVDVATDTIFQLNKKLITKGALLVKAFVAEDSPIEGLVNKGKIQANGDIIIKAKSMALDALSSIQSESLLRVVSDKLSNLGTIFAKILSIDLRQDIADLGKIGSSSKTELKTSGDINLASGKAISTTGSLDLFARNISNNGAIYSAGLMNLYLTGNLTQKGVIRSVGDINFSIDGSITTSAASQIYSDGSISIIATTLGNQGEIFAIEDLTSSFRTSFDNRSLFGAGRGLNISSGTISNYGYLQGGGVDIRSDNIQNNGTILATSSNLNISGSGGKTGAVYNYGTIETLAGDISITTGSFTNYGYASVNSIPLSNGPASLDSMRRYFDFYYQKPSQTSRNLYGDEGVVTLKPGSPFRLTEGMKDYYNVYLEGDWWVKQNWTKVYTAYEYVTGPSNQAKLISAKNTSINTNGPINISFSNITTANNLSFQGSSLTNSILYGNSVIVEHPGDKIVRAGHPSTGEMDRLKFSVRRESGGGYAAGSVSARGTITGNLARYVSNSRGAYYPTLSPKAPSSKAIPDQRSGPVPIEEIAPIEINAEQFLSDQDFKETLNKEISSYESAYGDEATKRKRIELAKTASMEVEFEEMPEISMISSKASEPMANSGEMEEFSSSDFIEASATDLVEEIDGIDTDIEDFDTKFRKSFGSYLYDFDNLERSFSLEAPKRPSRYYRIETNPDYTDPSKFFSTKNFADRIPGFKFAIDSSGLSAYSYTRMVRDQISRLAGHLDEGMSESELIEYLYDNGQKEVKRLNLRNGISLSAEQVAQLRSNIILNETVIKDGKIYSVPRVYLASGTKKEQGMFADTIEINADEIENASTIKARKINLRAKKSFTNYAAKIEARDSLSISAIGAMSNIGGVFSGGDVSISGGSIMNSEAIMKSNGSLKLSSSGDIVNLGGVMKSGGGIDIEGGSFASISTVNSRGIEGYSIKDEIGSEARIESGGKVRVATVGGQLYRGSKVKAGGNMEVTSRDGDVSIESIELMDEGQTGGGNHYHKWSHLRNVGSSFEAGGSGVISAGQDVRIGASDVGFGGKGSIVAGRNVEVASGKDIDYEERRSSTRSRGWHGGKRTKNWYSSSYEERLVGGSVEAGGGLSIESGGNIGTVGANISGAGISMKAESVELFAGKAESERVSSSNSSDRIYRASRDSGSSKSEYRPTILEGAAVIEASKVRMEVGDAPSSSLSMISPDVRVETVRNSSSSFSRRNISLTPEAAMIVGGAASLATGGFAGSVATSVVGGSTGAVAAGSHAAIVASVQGAASQLAVHTINNRGDIGKAIEGSFTGSGLESIGKSAISAGLASGIESGLGISAPKAGMGASQVYGNMAGRSVIRASVDGAVRGGTVESAARRAVGSFALGAAQYNVGEVGEKYGLEEGGAIKAAMHGFVGGVYAGSSGADPIIGAAAGMAGEIGASIDGSLRAERGSPENEMNGSPQSLVLLREDAVSDVSAKLGFGASVLAFAAGGDVDDMREAGQISQGVHDNNFIPHLLKLLPVAAKAALQVAKTAPKEAAKVGSKEAAKALSTESTKVVVKETTKKAVTEGVKKTGEVVTEKTTKEVAKSSVKAKVREASQTEVKFQRWKRGDAIDKPLPDGSNPSFDTVRSRYWKNRYMESKNSGEFGERNLERIQEGLAPQDINPKTGKLESRELHHHVPQRSGGQHGPINLREVTPDQHRALDKFRR